MTERKYPKKLVDAMEKHDPYGLYPMKYFEIMVSEAFQNCTSLERALGVNQTKFRRKIEAFDRLLEILSQLDFGDGDG